MSTALGALDFSVDALAKKEKNEALTSFLDPRRRLSIAREADRSGLESRRARSRRDARCNTT